MNVPIIIVGFMGCGKTTMARALARMVALERRATAVGSLEGIHAVAEVWDGRKPAAAGVSAMAALVQISPLFLRRSGNGRHR